MKINRITSLRIDNRSFIFSSILFVNEISISSRQFQNSLHLSVNKHSSTTKLFYFEMRHTFFVMIAEIALSELTEAIKKKYIYL